MIATIFTDKFQTHGSLARYLIFSVRENAREIERTSSSALWPQARPGRWSCFRGLQVGVSRKKWASESDAGPRFAVMDPADYSPTPPPHAARMPKGMAAHPIGAVRPNAALRLVVS